MCISITNYSCSFQLHFTASSMASSRQSSPVSDGGSPEPLTPRSKIRALLATVQSSDEEDGQSPKPTIRRNLKPLRRAASRSPSKTASRLSGTDAGSESDVEVRPRGRLASRMKGSTAAAIEKRPESTTGSVVNAEGSQDRNLVQVQAENATDDDNELPLAPRRLKRRAPRPSTPGAEASTARSASPGLFVSSPMQPSPAKSLPSEDELPAIKSDRFKALVERKRQERLAREAADEERRAERRAQQEKLASELEQLDSDDDDVFNIDDGEDGLRLTQMARPTRKASKKAIEEMNRETQRMARSMQLAHEAKTRKKITKASLFERFNFRVPGTVDPEPQPSSSSRPGSSHSDVEMEDAETPPSSPPETTKQAPAENERDVDAAIQPEAEPLHVVPVEDEATTRKLDKGKGKAVLAVEDVAQPIQKQKRQVRVKLPLKATTSKADDDLQITRSTKDILNAVFDSIPRATAKEPKSFQALRALALAKSPGREVKKGTGMSPGEFQVYIQQKAREQAKLERDRRLDMLKAQGIVIETVEERERQMQEVEDIVAKARDEAMKIMQVERAEAKENGEHDPLAWDDSDDEEYEEAADDADGEVSEVELSGSEDEEDDEEEDEDAANPIFDAEAEDAASEASGTASQVKDDGDEIMEEDDIELPVPTKRRARTQVAVLSDDEAEVEATPGPKRLVQMTPGPLKSDSPAVPTSVLRSARKNFIPGLPVKGPAGLGLTQIFAGTMDDSQMSPAAGPTQSTMPDFDNIADSNFSATPDQPLNNMIVDSQTDDNQTATQAVQLNFSQSQLRSLDSLLREDVHTQESEMIEPTQDVGFQEYTPLKERFIDLPTSTVQTVLLSQQETETQDSPLVKRGRLRRKMDTWTDDADSVDIVPSTEQSGTAFSALRKGAEEQRRRALADDFDRKKSKAKEMVEEQAEESEDEYAGLGGADGELSDNESLASVQDMIDDANGNDVDKDKLAAFFADRERANDEKEVEKLFKDITTGMLRRKRGADYDLSDSDDGGEARRRLKRRQFAKMQKALFSDERVKKMAENPGNQAFLRTIEDRNSDDEMDFLDVVEETSQVEAQSQSQEEAMPQQQTIPDSQPPMPLGASAENKRSHPRRTRGGKKPSNIGEIRETLSNLLEEPQGSIIPATEAGSDSEEETRLSPSKSDKENQRPHPRRTVAVAVVDRISLKRNASSNLSTGSSRLAFAVPAGSPTFKVPALLRRATTNSLVSGSSAGADSNNTPAESGSAGGFGEAGKIKRSAGRKSGVNAFARDSERRAKLQESERRREEKKVRGAEKRIGIVGGLLGKGSFA
ncbi:hypothetical protein S40285_07479 [Stachybotrys chlorohalonatus IBT 40285]|uniref:DNA replication checkpoint mediator MRC1 domain-containing protein n=1 Tax=Stachybotrys chlorohalonatus (strain IBT 40285) TaxID=1283841 RepID=A0A084QPT1_STAC4|nr:hypothetical protein S40285_07479 [Stachybotrys chlorohalonata IBT 40285]